jgi:hypothetical protein
VERLQPKTRPGDALVVYALRYLTAFLLGCGPLGAAQSASSFRFTVFSARPIADLAFVPRADAGAQKLVFHSTARSPRYEFRGALPLRFLDATGKIAAEATIPPEITDALLLFSALDTPVVSGLRYRVTVLDDSVQRHGAGGLVVVNLSGLDLSGNIGSHAVLLQAGSNPPLAIGRSAKIALRALFKGRTHASYVDSLELGVGQRALLILLPPDGKGSLEVQSRLLIDEPPAAQARAGISPRAPRRVRRGRRYRPSIDILA